MASTKMIDIRRGMVLNMNGTLFYCLDRDLNTYSYKDGDDFVFVDKESFEPVTLSGDMVGDMMKYLRENDDVKITFYNGNALSMELPQTVTLKVTETEPGIKGATAAAQTKPATLETGITVALANRPEIRVAELEEQLASAGLRLVRAQSKPDITAYTRYSQGRSVVELPAGAFPQRDRMLTFGVSIGIPVFNKNQGARAEAEIAIRQAQERRAFAEQVIRSEIVAAFQRIEATNRALSTLETGVLPRSRVNVETIQKVYEIGELKITDLIAEQRRLLDANRDLTETLTERYRANADLFNALGITLEN